MDEEKVTLHINIAGERIPLTVAFDEQDHVRDTERAVEKLFSEWRHRFRKKSDKEVLAMIAYQYASFYFTMARRYDEAVKDMLKRADDMEKLIDSTLGS